MILVNMLIMKILKMTINVLITQVYLSKKQ